MKHVYKKVDDSKGIRARARLEAQVLGANRLRQITSRQRVGRSPFSASPSRRQRLLLGKKGILMELKNLVGRKARVLDYLAKGHDARPMDASRPRKCEASLASGSQGQPTITSADKQNVRLGSGVSARRGHELSGSSRSSYCTTWTNTHSGATSALSGRSPVSLSANDLPPMRAARAQRNYDHAGGLHATSAFLSSGGHWASGATKSPRRTAEASIKSEAPSASYASYGGCSSERRGRSVRKQASCRARPSPHVPLLPINTR